MTFLSFLVGKQRADDACQKDRNGDTERDGRRDLCDAQHVRQEDLRADEDQNRSQGVFEVCEAVDQGGKRKVKGAQSKDREDVRRVDDERIGGDREDRRDRVDREDQVGDFDHDKRQEKRRDEGLQPTGLGVGLLDEETLLMKLLCDRQARAQELQDRVLANVLFLVICREQHLDAREHQEGGEEVENPVEVFDDRSTCGNHDTAQDDHAENTPEQHAVLILARDREVGKNHGDDEDIVHRQAFFHHEARDIFHRRLLTGLEPDPAAEGQADGDVEARHQQAFLDADFLGVLMQNAKIERQEA